MEYYCFRKLMLYIWPLFRHITAAERPDTFCLFQQRPPCFDELKHGFLTGDRDVDGGFAACTVFLHQGIHQLLRRLRVLEGLDEVPKERDTLADEFLRG